MTLPRIFGALIFGALSLFALPAAARRTYELLTPVDKTTEAKLRRSTNYELREQLYRAKRFRLVTVNFDVLDVPGGEIAITPFPDLSLRLMTVNTNETPEDGYRMWAGELLSPLSDDDRRPVRLFVYRGAVLPPSKQVVREIEAEGGEFDNSQITTLLGMIQLGSPLSTYYIEPVGDDPRYHVILEEDPNKVVIDNHGSSEISKERHRAAEEFREALKREKALAESEAP